MYAVRIQDGLRPYETSRACHEKSRQVSEHVRTDSSMIDIPLLDTLWSLHNKLLTLVCSQNHREMLIDCGAILLCFTP